MSTKNHNTPAHPTTVVKTEPSFHGPKIIRKQYNGLTKLEQAAIQIAAGITQSYFSMTPAQQEQQLKDWLEQHGEILVKTAIAKDAKAIALSLFEELDNNNPETK